ncbi:hypothetical protein GCM10011376_14400 [Nocardioides flavus (ex Wang et al. 2016)]|uniref:DUF2877 domain-containing protein n=1 Tax=Nocardioides flavus (ex Wang et al. 2016) TaxID=2058780 RepID=A0ABQ3HLV8_9ACTN|nr:DUF2877 domain-containing protein [Nocardioides flavus (ex Wang et al. 2016)]GHE16830.1 hypothetical protein GCM10011376_14400 [Nocardioides flavus (ex Wang et al. 2016)]
MSGPLPVAAPRRVRERLLAAADGPRTVLHASGTAIYVDLDGWCLGLVSATATRVPCALWSTLPDLGVLTDLARPDVHVRAGTLVVGGVATRVGRLVDVTAPAPRDHAERRRGPLHPVTAGLDLPADGRLTPAHLDDLVGRGPGLTPLGDDVLAGWLATRAAAGRPDPALATAVRRRFGATTLLSATLLDCALRGEVLPQLADWLAGPTAGATEALLAVGATSGAGLLTGAELALASLTARDPHDHRAEPHTTDRPGRAA